MEKNISNKQIKEIIFGLKKPQYTFAAKKGKQTCFEFKILEFKCEPSTFVTLSLVWRERD